MIGGLTVLALIPARGGSKRLPGKHLLPLAGKPLIAWTIEAAQQSRYIDRLVLSSDDEDIIAAAKTLGCEAPFRRPAELADDTASSQAVIDHALDQLPAHDLLLLLQPTSPLRSAQDIDAALEQLAAREARSLVSLGPSTKPAAFYYRISEDGRLRAALDLREEEALGVLNGALYLVRTEHYRRTGKLLDESTIAYSMPAERSVDVDTATDFALARALLELPYGYPPQAVT